MPLCVPNVDRILVIIPVHNEAETIASVIQSLWSHGLQQIRVVDNGSTDHSAAEAKAVGAEVVFEPKLGYGQACWQGLQNLPSSVEWILFCDGDGSDDLTALPQFFAACSNRDLILGNRRATAKSRSALTPVQNFGNGFAACLIQLGWGHRYHDLGPLRLIRRSALERIQMQDRGFGWTVEMQARAVELDLRICELPVNYYPRQGGQSKISGTLSGSIKAGVVILTVIAQLYWRRWRASKSMGLLWLSSLLLLVGCGWLSRYGEFGQDTVFPGFWIGVSLLSAGFLLSWKIRAIDAIWFWGVALLSRLLLLPMEPGNDIWRYLWEGYIQTLGYSPYQFAPNAPELTPHHTEWWWLINHLDVSAIYPPLTQIGFRILAFISPTVLLFKFAFISADILICWLLSRRFGYQSTLLYAWNPLILYSFAGSAHYDSWFILPLVAAWLSFDSIRSGSSDILMRYKSALLLGLSIAFKWMSLPILGFLLWQAFCRVRIKQVIVILILGCLPFGISALFFCQLGSCTLIPTSSGFVSYGRSAEFIPFLVSLIWQSALQANWIYALPLGCAVLLLLWHSKNFLRFAESYLYILLLLSPIIHAWYFTWLIPFAVASRNLGTCLVSISAFIYFVLPYRSAAGNPDWFLSNWERGILWLPLILGWAWSATNGSAVKIKREPIQ